MEKMQPGRFLDALSRAHADGDLARLGREAHRLKGAARMVGAVELAQAAAQLEAAAAERDWPKVAAYTADAQTAAERLRAHVAVAYPG